MILGIDPGVKGGIALLSDNGEVREAVALDGMTETELAAAMERLSMRALYPRPVCVVEKVGYIKGDGAMGAFTFGKVYGLLRGLALGFGLEIIDVYPMLWQSSLCCLSAGNKNVTKNKAIELFPSYHNELLRRPGKKGITHGIADALLIAEYGRRLQLRNQKL